MNTVFVPQVFIRALWEYLSLSVETYLERFYGHHDQYGYYDYQGRFVKYSEEHRAFNKLIPAHLTNISKTLNLVCDK